MAAGVPLFVHRLREVTSTQDEARRLVEAGEAGPAHVVVADVQTEGRGRFGRSWLSPAGGLYATYVVRRHPVLSLLSGLAAVRALDRFGIDAGLKWPNDVLVGDKKLAGILVETAGDVALVGIGINLREAPLETATSLADVGAPARRGELVVAIGEELEAARSADDTVTAYRSRSSTVDRSVRVTMEDGTTIEGAAVDVDAEGRIVVKTKQGTRAIASGECTHLRTWPSRPVRGMLKPRCDGERRDRGADRRSDRTGGTSRDQLPLRSGDDERHERGEDPRDACRGGGASRRRAPDVECREPSVRVELDRGGQGLGWRWD